MLTIGIDDAGRGPVIGPMVLAGCLMDDSLSEYLLELGVKDSKMLTPERREFLKGKIKDVCKQFSIKIIEPEQMDEIMNSGTNLNFIEAIMCAEIINELNDEYEKIKVIIDCPSVNTNSWKDYLIKKIKNPNNLDLVVVHKADRDYPVVSAASIIAKTSRDFEIEKLKEKIGHDFGSGYCSDPLTIEFLELHYEQFKQHKIFRENWQTFKTAMIKKNQKKLGDF